MNCRKIHGESNFGAQLKIRKRYMDLMFMLDLN